MVIVEAIRKTIHQNKIVRGKRNEKSGGIYPRFGMYICIHIMGRMRSSVLFGNGRTENDRADRRGTRVFQRKFVF